MTIGFVQIAVAILVVIIIFGAIIGLAKSPKQAETLLKEEEKKRKEEKLKIQKENKRQTKEKVKFTKNLENQSSGSDIGARLKKLRQMYKDGILSKVEFEKAKNKLLK